MTGALVDHIQTMLAALDRLEVQGYAFPDRVVTVLAAPGREALGERIAGAIPGAVPARLEHSYYDGLRFQISARGVNGQAVPLIDGGAFDWVAKLTSNRRLMYVASAIGAQLVAYLFRPPGLPQEFSIQPPPSTTSPS